MDVIKIARELGKAIQADERYQKFAEAQQKNDSDKELQEAIGEFNLKRAQLNAEVHKTDKDTEKIKEMDAELKAMYAKIFENKNMIEYTNAKKEIEEIINHVNAIISGSVSGQDPDGIDPVSACAGDCGGCAGCH